MRMTNFGQAPVHDPIYGIDRSNITDRLKRTNWRTKAVFRVRKGRCLYVLVQRGDVSDGGRRYQRYFVQIHLGSKDDLSLEWDFRTLREALAYANGDDGADLGRETRLAEPPEYPRSREADTYVTGFSRGPIPNLTFRIPGGYKD